MKTHISSKLKLLLFLTLFSALIFAGCSREKQAEKPKSSKATAETADNTRSIQQSGTTEPVRLGRMASPKAKAVSVQIAGKTAISRTIQLTGVVEPVRLARMASPAEGPVNSLLEREGDHVKKDQLLLTIGRTSGVEANVEAAQAVLNREREELQRVRQLVESGALPAEQLDNALVREASANAALNRSQEQSGDYRIKAPWDGIVMKVYVTDGDYVTPRLRLVDVYDPSSLVIRFSVPEAEALLLKIGLTMEVSFDAYPRQTFKARVIRVYPDLDRTLRTRTAEAVLTDNKKLAPGMFARLKLILDSHPDALVLPQEAVIVTPAGGQVIYLVEDGKAVQKKITTGIEEGNLVEILSGVDAGDSIIVKGNEKIKPGAIVKPIKADGK